MYDCTQKYLSLLENEKQIIFGVIDIVTRNGEYGCQTFNINKSLNPYFLASHIGYLDFLFISDLIDLSFIKSYA